MSMVEIMSDVTPAPREEKASWTAPSVRRLATGLAESDTTTATDNTIDPS